LPDMSRLTTTRTIIAPIISQPRSHLLLQSRKSTNNSQPSGSHRSCTSSRGRGTGGAQRNNRTAHNDELPSESEVLEHYLSALRGPADHAVVEVEPDDDGNTRCFILPTFKIIRGRVEVQVTEPRQLHSSISLDWLRIHLACLYNVFVHGLLTGYPSTVVSGGTGPLLPDRSQVQNRASERRSSFHL
jgi:hypothetical protein